jgi:Rrf2 family cysteine metabolism transcriptional repressor
MFTLNRTTEYGLALLRSLAKLEPGEFLSLRKFAKENKFSLFLAQKVARILRLNRLIASKYGAAGGYYLVGDPKKISVKDVIEILGGECGVVPCFKGKKCAVAKICKQKRGLRYLDKSILEILEKTKITDL